MKLKLIMFCAVMVFASSGGIFSAQARSDEIQEPNVPFDLHTGGQEMAAGNYTISVDPGTQMITLSDGSDERKMFLIGIAGDGDQYSDLGFDHSANTRFLEDVLSDVVDLTFHTKVPEPAMESRMELPQVKVALNR